LKYETAGHPISGLKWTRKTTKKVSEQLKVIGIEVSPNTVCRLLKDMGFSLRVNSKKIESGLNNPPDPEKRDQQFGYIGEMREFFAQKGLPIISVDTKKKELIGKFKNNGKAWQKETVAVYDHDFPTDAKGKAIPYGIYDTQKNIGTVFVGRSTDTPPFSVDCIEAWWKSDGKKHYPDSDKLLVLADSGGSNSYRSRVWKYQLQKQLCDKHGLSVHICHYPPGSSKWNPIEHRLFSEISKNWAGRPLDSFETVLKYLRTTKTSTGLSVKAHYIRKKYETGERVSDTKMEEIRIEKHEVLSQWSYNLRPSNM
jgi:hypothetical protein